MASKNSKANGNSTKFIGLPKISFFWNGKERPRNSDTVLINGKLLVFFVCSLISGFINLVFIANLTKSDYGIGTLINIKAAILLGFLSIGLDLSKLLHAIQVNTLDELQRKLSKHTWSVKIKNVRRKWHIMYVLYVALSVITSVSLSSISIGAGITRNSNTLKQIDEFIVQGEQYSGVDSTAKNIQMQNLVGKATDTSEQDAIAFVNKQVSEVWPKIQEWQEEYTEFLNNELDPNDKTVLETPYNGSKNYYDYWTKRDREINALLSSSKYSNSNLNESSIRRLTLAAFESAVKTNYLKTMKTTSSDEAASKLAELTDTTMEEAYAWIETLNNIQLVNPKNGEIVVFDTDKEKSTKVLIAAALTRLKALRVDVENDSGDIGSSSKIFMQLGSTIDSIKTKHNETTDLTKVLTESKTSTSLGSTEIMMMAMLLFLSLLCEIAINQFSPKTNISRKMLGQFSQHFDPSFDVNDFMLDVYIEQFNYGQMSKKQFDIAVKETLDMMKITKESLLEQIKKPASKNIVEKIVEKTKNNIEIAKDVIGQTVLIDKAEPAPAVEPKVEVRPLRETKPSSGMIKLHGDTISSQAVPATVETPVVEMKPVVEEKPQVDETVNKLSKLNEVLTDFEKDLGDN